MGKFVNFITQCFCGLVCVAGQDVIVTDVWGSLSKDGFDQILSSHKNLRWDPVDGNILLRLHAEKKMTPKKSAFVIQGACAEFHGTLCESSQRETKFIKQSLVWMRCLSMLSQN